MNQNWKFEIRNLIRNPIDDVENSRPLTMLSMTRSNLEFNNVECTFNPLFKWPSLCRVDLSPYFRFDLHSSILFKNVLFTSYNAKNWAQLSAFGLRHCVLQPWRAQFLSVNRNHWESKMTPWRRPTGKKEDTELQKKNDNCFWKWSVSGIGTIQFKLEL